MTTPEAVLERRLGALEKTAEAHARIITGYDQQIAHLLKRLEDLEESDGKRLIEDARRAEREINLLATISRIEKQLVELGDGNKWLLRTVIAAVAVAFVTFVIKGGLSI